MIWPALVVKHRICGGPACLWTSTSVRRRRVGYTLAELMVTLPIMAMLTLCMGSAITIAVKSVPGTSTISSTTLVAARALDMLAGELCFATSITSNVTSPAAARQISFVIPDRDGQTPANETITYSWSGVAGDPLLRTFNSVTTTVASDVRDFSLAYDKREIQLPVSTTTRSAEMLLLNRDGNTTTGTLNSSLTTWAGEFIQPALANNVTGWNITKVEFVVRKDNTATGTLNVQIRTAASRLPTNTVIVQQPVAESSLPAALTLFSVNLVNMPMQSPQDGVCLVLQVPAGSPSPVGTLQYWAGGQLNAQYLTTSNTGTSWSTSTGNSLRLNVYGTVDTTSSSSSTRYFLTNVRCVLRVGDNSASLLTASFRIPNEPEVAGP